MRDTIEARLSTLQTEHDAGQKMLAEIDERRASLTQTLLRIEGAMQVLQELLRDDAAVTPPEDPSPGSPGS